MRKPPVGASDELIAAAERALGVSFPEELKDVWRTCNGLTLKRSGWVVHPLFDPSAPRETAAHFVLYNTERRPPAMDASLVSIATDSSDHLVLRRHGATLETEVRLWLHHTGTTRRYGGLDKILREASARARHVQEGKAGRSRRERDEEANLAIVRAVQSRDPARLESTLARAAVVPRKNGQALTVAALALRADLLEILLRHGYHADATFCGMRPLNRLSRDVSRGGAEVAAVLLAHGADPNKLDGNRWGPLHHAAKGGDAELVRALIAGGADPSAPMKGGLRPLHVATGASVVRALVEGGAQVDAPAQGNNTPLMIVAGDAHHSDSVRVIDALLEAGADPDAVNDNGDTPLMIAALSARWDVGRRLLDVVKDVDKGRHGYTPFLITMVHRSASALAFAKDLVARGASVHATDGAGRTALDYVFEWPAGPDREAAREWLLASGVGRGA